MARFSEACITILPSRAATSRPFWSSPGSNISGNTSGALLQTVASRIGFAPFMSPMRLRKSLILFIRAQRRKSHD